MVVVSLTHLRVHRTLPFATAVLEYQKHRVKKLKKLKKLKVGYSTAFLMQGEGSVVRYSL